MFYEKQFLELKTWLYSFEGKVLFCSGAFGDFFLGLDIAMKHNLPIIYWSKPYTLDLSHKFLKAFGLKYYVINVGKEIWRDKNTYEFCNHIREEIKSRGFRTHGNNKCHLPCLDFKPDVTNRQYANFKNCKLDLPEKYALFCPSGSTTEKKIRKFFSKEEFDIICKLLKDKNVEPIIVGSEVQLKKYDNYKKFKWLEFEKFEGKKISVNYFIEAVRCCSFVISPDTSIKTLSAAMHIPTYVLRTRNQENNYISVSWDVIFLDKNKWKTIERFTFNELVQRLYGPNKIKML